MITGAGAPVTVVAHGLGASISETRPLLSGVPGTKVFFQARGHGDAPVPLHPGYAELAADLTGIADSRRATQALGVSLGAHTILRAMTEGRPFDRVVLFLPAALDTARDPNGVRRLAHLTTALGNRDLAAVQALVRAELPPDVDAEPYVASRAAFLLASPGLPALLAALADDPPVPDRAALSAVTADVLVLAQEGDPLHPAAVARELVALLPTARLVVFDRPGAVFHERARLRELICAHLSRLSPPVSPQPE